MAPSKRTQVEETKPVAKKQNTTFSKKDIQSFFTKQIWDTKFQDDLKDQIANSEPYKWGSITDLIDDTLLRNVRKEVLSEIAFTKKKQIFIKFSNWVI